MDIARRTLLAVIAVTAVARSLGYLLHAAPFLLSPLEAYHLEAKMALLAYRVQLGATLYPRWEDYPHVANFFGPVYFALVGLLSAALRADIPGLLRIGRGVTFLATLATAPIVWRVAARQYGRVAGGVAAVLTLGPAPTIGITFMVRPDALADVLGLAGFLLTGARTRTLQLLGGALLVLAILTKQTCALYLAAAVLALFLEGRRVAAGTVAAGCTAALAAIVVGVNTLVEPNFIASLLGEAPTPWATKYLLQTARQTGRASPDLFVLTTVGIALWLTRAQRNVRFATLAVVLLVGGGLASGKCGASMNYYLGLRAVAGLAAAALWQATGATTRRARWAALACCTLVVAAFTPTSAAHFYGAYRGWNMNAFLASPRGRDYLRVHQALLNRARSPSFRVLTDWGMLELYQGRRAAFGDPWLFRLMVLTGRIDPVLMKRRIDAQYYDLVVTTSDIMRPEYADYEFGLPSVLAERVRARYAPRGMSASLFFYEPRRGGPAAGTPVGPRAGSW